jgi:hypothetical protein
MRPDCTDWFLSVAVIAQLAERKVATREVFDSPESPPLFRALAESPPWRKNQLQDVYT